MSELAKMRAVAAAEFDQKFPPPSMELPGDEYDSLEEQRKVEWGAWWEAWQLMAERKPAPVVPSELRVEIDRFLTDLGECAVIGARMTIGEDRVKELKTIMLTLLSISNRSQP